MLKKISLQALQFALDRALSLDPNIAPQLHLLEGKSIEMIISPLNVHFYILIQGGRLLLTTKSEQLPDTIIHSSPMGLIRLSLLPSSKMRSLFNDNIQMSGDLELGRDLKKIMDNIDIDWEGHLAHFTGDVVAHHIGKVVRKGRSFGRHYIQSVKQNTQDYLSQETALLTTTAEVEQFNQEVDELRLRTERLIAHFNQWLAQYERS